MDAKPVLATGNVIDLQPTHPLALSEALCPACDGPLAGTKIVLVLAGISPEDRERATGAWGTGGAVAVHAAGAGVAPDD
jgi:hypothetical protein